MAPQVGLEPTLDTLEECCLSLRLLRYGALPPTRTGNTLLLREPRLPIAPEGHCLVLPPGIEPGSTVLQTAAMTTSAKVAKLVQVVCRTTCKAGVCSIHTRFV